MNRAITRRDLLKFSGALATASLLAGYAPTYAATQVVQQTVPIAQEAVPAQQTQATTKLACLWCSLQFNDRKGLEAHVAAAHPGKGFGPIPVAINISSIDTKEQLKRRVDELVKRNFIVTLGAGGVIDQVGGDYIKELAKAGFDISVPAKVDTTLSLEEKLAQTKKAKQALELLLGTPVKSFASASKFAIDKDTTAIIGQLGGGYIHVSSRTARFPDCALEPVQEPGFDGVVRCYQQSRGLYNKGSDLLVQDVLAMSGSN